MRGYLKLVVFILIKYNISEQKFLHFAEIRAMMISEHLFFTLNSRTLIP